jgi:membrane protein insertase Oxa1/YidC/SpoIIIJ
MTMLMVLAITPITVRLTLIPLKQIAITMASVMSVIQAMIQAPMALYGTQVAGTATLGNN